jgi:hypothetical protein
MGTAPRWPAGSCASRARATTNGAIDPRRAATSRTLIWPTPSSTSTPCHGAPMAPTSPSRTADADALTGTPRAIASCATGVLAPDRDGDHDVRGVGRRGRVMAGRGTMVSPRWWDDAAELNDPTGRYLSYADPHLVIAGYTAREMSTVQAHIAELAAIGVTPPPTVPRFCDLDPALLTTASSIQLDRPGASGELEPVVIRSGGRLYLGIGSNHSESLLEVQDVHLANAAAPKPLAGEGCRTG